MDTGSVGLYLNDLRTISNIPKKVRNYFSGQLEKMDYGTRTKLYEFASISHPITILTGIFLGVTIGYNLTPNSVLTEEGRAIIASLAIAGGFGSPLLTLKIADKIKPKKQ